MTVPAVFQKYVNHRKATQPVRDNDRYSRVEGMCSSLWDGCAEERCVMGSRVVTMRVVTVPCVRVRLCPGVLHLIFVLRLVLSISPGLCSPLFLFYQCFEVFRCRAQKWKSLVRRFRGTRISHLLKDDRISTYCFCLSLPSSEFIDVRRVHTHLSIGRSATKAGGNFFFFLLPCVCQVRSVLAAVLSSLRELDGVNH